MKDKDRLLKTPLEIDRFFYIVLSGLLLACLYHYSMHLLGFGFPWTTFLFDPNDRFNDWHNSIISAAAANPYYSNSPALSTYFPFSYVVFDIGVGRSGIANRNIYLGISIVLLLFSIFLAWRSLGPRSTTVGARSSWVNLLFLFGAFLLAYPTIFALDRGNLDIWIASFCAIYVALLRTRYAFWGFVFLAFAIMLKGYPLAFLLLGIQNKKYKLTILCAAVSVLVSLLILAGFSGGFVYSLNGLRNNMGLFYERYVIGSASLFASSDPYNGLRILYLIIEKGCIRIFGGWIGPTDLSRVSRGILKFYAPMSFFFAAAVSFFVLFISAPFWRKVMAIGLLVIFFPNVANDYKLTLLFPGMLSLLLESNGASRNSKYIFALCACLFIPKSYLFIGGYGLSNILNPALLLVLAYFVLADGVAWAEELSVFKKTVRQFWNHFFSGRANVLHRR